MIIGICGKSGSGKSTLAKSLVNKDTIYLDIDKIGHKSHQDKVVKQKLINTFTDKILTDNRIDRKKLSKIVFSSKSEMNKLTNITWDFMQKEIDNFIKENENKIIILDWQLLPKTKYFNMCNIKILLDIPYEIRKERIILRDNITKDEFDLREKASYDYNNNEFDYVITDNKQIERIQI